MEHSWRKPNNYYIDKYRVGTKTIPLAYLGVHRANRGGVYPSGPRVQSLCMELLNTGFCKTQANHYGVCVLELHQGIIPEGYITTHQFNLTNTIASKEL